MAKAECEKPLPFPLPPGVSVFEMSEKIRNWLDTGLDNYERLEVFYSLLRTMTNLEVRYFHSILHSFMGGDWQSVFEAQELIRRANDVFTLRDLYSSMESPSLLTSEVTRSQVILDLSVLHSVSTSCADIICDFVERAGIGQHVDQLEDDDTVSDLLLIVSMLFRHPACRFHRRVRLGQIAMELVGQRMEYTKLPRFPPATAITATSTSSLLPDDLTRGNNAGHINYVYSEGAQPEAEWPPVGPRQPLVASQQTTPVSSDAACETPSAPLLDQSKLKSLSDTSVPMKPHCADPAIMGSSSRNAAGSDSVIVSRSIDSPAGESVIEKPAKPRKPSRVRAPKSKPMSCYNCGGRDHWGQDCQKKSYWDRDPYSEVNHRTSTDETYRKTTKVFRSPEVYYAQKHSKPRTGK